ncbi:nucleotide exchange factor GrpE [Histomonas meleagridis]|uniref:nucleotide exchange factor GrpE n=1 Tax=Histomonas meleagridis TaxID=135588 RepID=UPI00355A87C5|nr:nucleotide exchange factor GrpE [Histomonas meleagridis]KAH0805159.1 nucleotide exchange factor GrpE [Histomonas meleagridis]
MFTLRNLEKAAENIIKEEVTPEIQNNKIEEEKDKKQPTIEELQKELKEANNRNLYLLADFENARRRFQKLSVELENTAISTMAKQLLPVADNIRRVQDSGKKQTVESILEAVGIIDSELHNVFNVFKIERMSSKGAKFNPEFHDAVATIPPPKGVESGHIVDVVTEGYTLAGKLLRAAKVVVAK